MEPSPSLSSPHRPVEVAEGRRLHGAGDLAGAEAVYRAVLAARPDHGEALHLMGVLRHQQGRDEEAVDLIRAAIAVDPAADTPWRNLVLPLVRLGRTADALAAAATAVERAPDQAAAWVNAGLAAFAAGQDDRAEEAALAALALDPAQTLPWQHLGAVHLRRRRFAAAERLFRRALALAPHARDAAVGLGEALVGLDRFDEAAAVWRRLVDRDGGDLTARVNLGAALRNAGDLDGALAAWTGGAAAPELDYNAACLRLLRGDWRAGFAGYERRLDVPIEPLPARLAAMPRWTGTERVETLLLHHEQGLGDSIQFAPYCARLLERVGRIVLVCQRPIAALIAAMEPIRAAGTRIRVVGEGDPVPPADAYLPLMSVADRLALTPETVAAKPVVAPDPDRAAAWAAALEARLPPRAEAPLRVGVVWQGNPAAPAERGRSLPLAALAPLAAVPGVALVSLQKKAGVEQLAAAPFPILDLGAGFDAGADAFLDTVAVAAGLDLVIAVDTAVAHVVAASGRPVWLMLRAIPDWRWGLGADASPWYPSVRLFRQTRRGRWDDVVERLAEALGGAVAARRDGPPEDAAVFEQAVADHRAGRPAAAVPVYRARLARDPEDARAMNFLGLALMETGGRDPAVAAEAADLARRSSAASPEDATVVGNAAVILKAAGAIDEAAALLRRVLAADPVNAAAVQNLVNLEIQRGDAAEAVRVANAAAARAPRDPTLLKALAAALRAVKRPAEAVAALRLALALTPDDHGSRNTLGSILAETGDEAGARAVFEEVLERDPGNVDGWSNLGVVEKRIEGPEAAIWFYQRAIARDGRHVDARANLGSALVELGRWDLAEGAFRAALTLRPSHPEARMALGMTLLAAGRFADGFAAYEGRVGSERLGLASATPAKIPRWAGEDVAGRTILVLGEQGFGDVLQFVRYAAVLKRKGAARVIVGCRRRLAPLLAGVAGVDAVAVEGDAVPAADFHVFAMSLPHLCGTRLDTLPAAVPYLAPDPDRVTRWAERLAEKPGFRVGLVWQGNPDPGVDRGRSLRLAALAPLAAIPGVRLIALQRGPGAEQVEALGGLFPVETLGEGADEDGAFVDTTAVMANLDLVISTDTAALHLAGALGRPAFGLLKRHAEWRWLREREDSPWYPTLRLFRQTDAEADAADPFAGAIRRAADALAAAVAGDRRALLPRAPESLPAEPPRTAAARFADALAAHRAGDTARAVRLYRAVLDDAPAHAEAIHMLGAAALQAGRHRRALILLREAVALGLDTPELAINLAVALRRTGRVGEAEATVRRVIATSPRAEAYATLGGLLHDAGRLDEAVSALETAVRLDPALALAQRTLGNALRDAGRPDAALASLDRAVALAPDDAEAHIDRAHARLALGDYRGGFSDYEWRFGGAELAPRSLPVPRWDGTPFDGTLLVHGEQGLGDNIAFARFAIPALARAGRVVLEVRRPLMALLATLHPDVTVVEQGAPLPPVDREVPLLSLPHVLGLDVDGVGMDEAYLSAEPFRVARWRDRLGIAEGPTVGLVWQGNPKARADKGRSPPLAALAPMLALPGVRFLSLQKEHGLEQLAGPLADRVRRLPADFDEGPDAFLDSAAILALCDLVVTSDTALAHLAGALARPTFLMLKHAPDWRWMIGRDDSPWYPTLRLFRQPAPGDWAAVGAALAEALAERVPR